MPINLSGLAATLIDTLGPGQMLNQIVTQLIRKDATQSARLLLKLSRIQHRHKSADDGEPQGKQPVPQGPFTVDPKHACALLLYVPRNLKSRLIDDGTGHYGYSHVAIDCAEVDQPTGKHVMTESTTRDVVHRSFQDHYGSRPFARVDLSHLKLDAKEFRSCVNDKLGEPYDDKEALTWGAIDDPAKQICSDLAGDCMPSEVRDDIAQQRLAGKLRELSVSVHQRFRKKPHVFISPNGFAEYFGAPPGSELTEPDTLVMQQSASEAGGGASKMFGQAIAVVITLGLCVCGAWFLTERLRLKR